MDAPTLELENAVLLKPNAKAKAKVKVLAKAKGKRSLEDTYEETSQRPGIQIKIKQDVYL